MSRNDRVLIGVAALLCLAVLASRLLPYDALLALLGDFGEFFFYSLG
jgi:hypothetical protein